ncbi:hypothetical protein [Heliorestis convoluta]|uniref:Uncharacterized protein n=1 Tax=Heliorestis convoluta TaxID=356322 RepID=A0A5Q2N0R4_9FIRM|nr:hypothetical protein [Heliorestis convoluta]QGG47389.1 hypothetical protein FTV88_1242 [Heliorestis convoluta]
MSKIYICSTHRDTKAKVILELPTSEEAKQALQRIKRENPKISIGVYGSRDLATFKRTQRALKSPTLVKSVDDFLEAMNEKEMETV